MRLHVDSTLAGTKDIALVDKSFKVYTAAAAQFDMPQRDGNRDFSFQVFAAGDLDLTGRASIVYNQDTLSSLHRSSARIGAAADTVAINGRTVKRVTASGQFPFTKSYWDDVGLTDVTETVVQSGDVLPVAIQRCSQGGLPNGRGRL